MTSAAPFRTDATEEDMRAINYVAKLMVTAVPNDTPPHYMTAVVGVLVTSIFTSVIDAEMRLTVFDDWTSVMRQQIKQSLT